MASVVSSTLRQSSTARFRLHFVCRSHVITSFGSTGSYGERNNKFCISDEATGEMKMLSLCPGPFGHEQHVGT